MKKVPYEKFIRYLLLARNSFPNISCYIKAYKLGTVNGHILKYIENEIKAQCDIDELSYFEKTRVTKAPKSEETIEINLVIPKEMARLAQYFEFTKSPFENASIKFVVENIMLRRAVEVYLTTKMALDEVCKLVNERFRIKLKEPDIEEYESWMYDINDLAPDDMYKYFASLDHNEQEYKYMAFMKKEDYVKWKMGDDCEIDPQAETRRMMIDALNSFKDTISQNPPNHVAAKVWSDIYFKCMEHLENQANTKDTQVFARFKFNMVKNEANKPVMFSELLEKSKGK